MTSARLAEYIAKKVLRGDFHGRRAIAAKQMRRFEAHVFNHKPERIELDKATSPCGGRDATVH